MSLLFVGLISNRFCFLAVGRISVSLGGLMVTEEGGGSEKPLFEVRTSLESVRLDFDLFIEDYC